MIFKNLKEKLIHYRLNRAYRRATQVTGHNKIIIFSDHHKGIGDAADDFKQCASTYTKALNYYFQAGYTLILLGDIEELWENDINDVIKANKDSFEQEAQFYHDKRYFRCFGNHDLQWSRPQTVTQYFKTNYPNLTVTESILITIGQQRFFLTHGHQGDIMSDLFAPLSKILVRSFWRWYQLISKQKLSSLSDHFNQIQWHDHVLYNWITSQPNLKLITGHTHRPIWLSQTKEEQNTSQLTEKQPVYFNTGCCSYADGDITGIELHQDSIQLIKFSSHSSNKIDLATLKWSEINQKRLKKYKQYNKTATF